MVENFIHIPTLEISGTTLKQWKFIEFVTLTPLKKLSKRKQVQSLNDKPQKYLSAVFSLELLPKK